MKSLSRVRLLATPWSAAYQAPPSMGCLGKSPGVGAIELTKMMPPVPASPSEEEVKSLSRVQFFATPWTAAHQPPPSMGFSRQEYCCGVAIAFSIRQLRLRDVQSFAVFIK